MTEDSNVERFVKIDPFDLLKLHWTMSALVWKFNVFFFINVDWNVNINMEWTFDKRCSSWHYIFLILIQCKIYHFKYLWANVQFFLQFLGKKWIWIEFNRFHCRCVFVNRAYLKSKRQKRLNEFVANKYHNTKKRTSTKL